MDTSTDSLTCRVSVSLLRPFSAKDRPLHLTLTPTETPKAPKALQASLGFNKMLEVRTQRAKAHRGRAALERAALEMRKSADLLQGPGTGGFLGLGF